MRRVSTRSSDWPTTSSTFLISSPSRRSNFNRVVDDQLGLLSALTPPHPRQLNSPSFSRITITSASLPSLQLSVDDDDNHPTPRQRLPKRLSRRKVATAPKAEMAKIRKRLKGSATSAAAAATTSAAAAAVAQYELFIHLHRMRKMRGESMITLDFVFLFCRT